MKALSVLVVLILVVACFGFYRGWFQLSSENTDNKSNVTFSVDQDKIQADEKTAKEKVQDFGHKVKEKTGNRTDTVKEEDNQKDKEKVQDLGHKVKEKTGDRNDKVEEQERRP